MSDAVDVADVAEENQHLFDVGYCCTESVVMTAAGARGIQPPQIRASAAR